MLHEIEAVDLMQISTIHKFAKSCFAKQCYGIMDWVRILQFPQVSMRKSKYMRNILIIFWLKSKKRTRILPKQLRMPVHKFRKLLMHFSQQLYNKSYGIKSLKQKI